MSINRSILGIVEFKGFTCNVLLDRYVVDQSPALVLVDSTTHEPVTRVTSNVSDIIPNLPKNLVAIKNYSENEGILDVLVDANIISKPIDYIVSNHINIPICKLYV